MIHSVATTIPLLRGMQLGAATVIQAASMDTMQQPPCPWTTSSVYEAHLASLVNLLIIGPVMYSVVHRFTKTSTGFWWWVFQTCSMTIVHSALYTSIHRMMHKCKWIRPIHRFHHRFSTNVTPSVANAVSPLEFVIAYMLPFAVGATILRPTESALDASVAIVSMFNLMVHDPNLHNVPWPTLFVPPSIHLGHHKTREPHYSAPTLAWGVIHDSVTNHGIRVICKCKSTIRCLRKKWTVGTTCKRQQETTPWWKFSSTYK